MLVRLEGETPLPLLQSPGGKGVWGEITFTADPVAECDLVLVSNRATKEIRVRCPKGGKWLFPVEPPEGYYSYFKLGYPEYDFILSQWEDGAESARPGTPVVRTWGPTAWYARRSYDEYMALRPEACGKQDRVSLVMSQKKKQTGHKLRHALRAYLDERGYSYDIFGGKEHFIEDKCQALLPYKYTIAVENSAHPHYWTEKIADAFLCWSMPVYWGAPNITDYFPAEAMIRLDADDFAGSVERLEEAVRTDLWSRNFEALREARDRVLNRYQFFPFFHDLIQQHYRPEGPAVEQVIPALHHPKEKKLSYRLKKWLGIYALKERLRHSPWIEKR